MARITTGLLDKHRLDRQGLGRGRSLIEGPNKLGLFRVTWTRGKKQILCKEELN